MLLPGAGSTGRATYMMQPQLGDRRRMRFPCPCMTELKKGIEAGQKERNHLSRPRASSCIATLSPCELCDETKACNGRSKSVQRVTRHGRDTTNNGNAASSARNETAV
jgi:hypothetical protein